MLDYTGVDPCNLPTSKRAAVVASAGAVCPFFGASDIGPPPNIVTELQAQGGATLV